jgi:hypothetical protein
VKVAVVIGFAVAIAFALALLSWNYVSLRVQVALASEQCAVFEQMKDRARQGSLQEAIQCMNYVLNYYPSGTKQNSGSQLDSIVERARKQALTSIINDCRARHAVDFGDDPHKWIDHGRTVASELPATP